MAKKTLTLKKLFKEFIPISMSDWAMALGDPMIAFALALLPGGAMHLAVFGVAKGVAVFCESPIIMVLHASNALSRNRPSHRSLSQFSLLLGGTMSVVLMGAGFGFTWLTQVGVGAGLSPEAQSAVGMLILILTPWPLLIAWRRLHQGKLIGAGASQAVAIGSLLRLVVTAISLMILLQATDQGYWLAGGAMLFGLVTELVYILVCSRRRESLHHGDTSEAVSARLQLMPVGLVPMASYYLPLAWTMVSLWGSRLGLTLVLASIDETITAIWTVGWALVVSLGNGVRMVQQIVIRHNSPEVRGLVGSFVWFVGAGFSGLFLVVGLSPWGLDLCYRYVGQDAELAMAVQNLILSFTPFALLLAWQNALQGSLMTYGWTKAIGRTALVTNIGLLLMMAGMARWFGLSLEGTVFLVQVLALLEVATLAILATKAARMPSVPAST